MATRIGILTAGGDCPGLNATIRGVAKAMYQKMDDVEIVGIVDGFKGLIEGEYHEMKQSDFSGILTRGGTILGTARTPYKSMKIVENDVDKVARMKGNYKKMKLDCLMTLGGNGTHKTANLLSEEGLNVIGLPKTIDNDIWGTDVTFGFHTAVGLGTEVLLYGPQTPPAAPQPQARDGHRDHGQQGRVAHALYRRGGRRGCGADPGDPL